MREVSALFFLLVNFNDNFFTSSTDLNKLVKEACQEGQQEHKLSSQDKSTVVYILFPSSLKGRLSGQCLGNGRLRTKTLKNGRTGGGS